MLTAQGRTSTAVLASGALHLLLSLGPAQRAVQLVKTPDSMEFEVVASLSVASRAPSPREQVAWEPPSMPRARRRVIAPEAKGRAEPTGQLPVAPPERADAQEPAAAPPVAAGRALAEGPRALELSPLAAARTLSTDKAASWALPARPDSAAVDSADRALEAELARAIPELSRANEQRADQIAQDANWALAKPWEYIRQPLRGARYHYRGLGFDAIIRADGSLEYRNKDGLQLMSGQTTARYDQPPAATFGVGYRGDPVNDGMLGRDSHGGERQKLLERSRPLRELLRDRALRRALERAAKHLTEKLVLIDRKLEVGDDEAARAQLFALWDECAEDAVGAPARRRIEQYVREHCADGSALGFPAPELLALNQQRTSRQRFAPYALASDAGALSDSGHDAAP